MTSWNGIKVVRGLNRDVPPKFSPRFVSEFQLTPLKRETERERTRDISVCGGEQTKSQFIITFDRNFRRSNSTRCGQKPQNADPHQKSLMEEAECR